jgi:Fe-S cluster biogenesis protein NfuA
VTNAVELKTRIATLLAEEIAPALAMNSNRLEVLDVVDRVVRIRITLACRGCPNEVMTILMGIEQEIRRRIPEIEYLEAVH